MKSLTTKKFFEIAGVDTAKGKAKQLLENASNSFVAELAHVVSERSNGNERIGRAIIELLQKHNPSEVRTFIDAWKQADPRAAEDPNWNIESNDDSDDRSGF